MGERGGGHDAPSFVTMVEIFFSVLSLVRRYFLELLHMAKFGSLWLTSMPALFGRV